MTCQYMHSLSSDANLQSHLVSFVFIEKKLSATKSIWPIIKTRRHAVYLLVNKCKQIEMLSAKINHTYMHKSRMGT